MSSDTIKVNAIFCTRCGKKQYPQINRSTGEVIYSKQCYHCRNPYYLKPIVKESVSISSKKRHTSTK